MVHIHARHTLAGRHHLDDALTPFEALTDALHLTLQGGCQGDLNAPEYHDNRCAGSLVFANTTKAAVTDILTRAGISFVTTEARYIASKGLVQTKAVWQLPKTSVLVVDAPTNPHNDFVVVNFHPDAVGDLYDNLAKAL